MIQYNPIKINPSRPMSIDVATSLANTIREGDIKAREANSQLVASVNALPTAPEEEAYKQQKLAELQKTIEDNTYFGSQFWAYDDILKEANKITTDPILNDSIKSYQNYNTWKQGIQERTDISDLTKNRVIAQNPYTSTISRTDAEGKIKQWEFTGSRPVKDVAIGEIFDAALRRLNPEYFYKEDFVFYDEAGKSYHEYIPGKTIMMVNKNTNETIDLSKETIEGALRAEINTNPQYRQAIDQQRQNIDWYKDQDDYNHQFDSFINPDNGEVVDYDTYIDRLVNPLVNPVAYKKVKNTEEWDATTIKINSDKNSKGSGDEEETPINTSGLGISTKGYNETYTNTLTTEVVAIRDNINDEVSLMLSGFGVDMHDKTVDINNPDDVINIINNSEQLSPETKRNAINYITTVHNYYQTQNNQYDKMLDEASYEGKINKIALDAIMTNKKIDFDALRNMGNGADDSLAYITLKDTYDNCYDDFFSHVNYIGGEPSRIHYNNSGVYFEDNDSYNKFISLYGSEKYLLDQGYKIEHKNGKHIVYISDTNDNLMFQFASKIKDFTSLYDGNKIKKYLKSSGVYKHWPKKGESYNEELYFKDMPKQSVKIVNKIQKIRDKTIEDFGDQEVIVHSKISITPDPILDDKYGLFRMDGVKYTEFKGKLEVTSNRLEQSLRQSRNLNAFDVQIGDDETGEYRDIKRKELDKIQSLIRNPESKIYIAYTTSMNGLVPYCTVIGEDGKSYNFTIKGWLQDPVIEELNKDIQYTYIANNHAYAGYDMQIGVNNDGQAISLRAEDNGDDTFSFYLIDNNGERIDDIKLDSYDAATLKKLYDELAPYIEKQYSKEGLTQKDYEHISFLTTIFNNTLINNYAKNAYNRDPRTEKEITDFLNYIGAEEENWLNVGGVSIADAFLRSIGLTLDGLQ